MVTTFSLKAFSTTARQWFRLCELHLRAEDKSDLIKTFPVLATIFQRGAFPNIFFEESHQSKALMIDKLSRVPETFWSNFLLQMNFSHQLLMEWKNDIKNKLLSCMWKKICQRNTKLRWHVWNQLIKVRRKRCNGWKRNQKKKVLQSTFPHHFFLHKLWLD